MGTQGPQWGAWPISKHPRVLWLVSTMSYPEGEQTDREAASWWIAIRSGTLSPAIPKPVMLGVLLWGLLVFNLQI